MCLLDQLLLRSLEEKILLKIFREEICDDKHFGFVQGMNEDFVHFSLYNTDGYYDGVFVIDKEDISRIRWQGNELDSLQKLIKRNSLEPEIPKIELDSWYTVLQDLNDKYQALSICTEDVDEDVLFLGHISQIDSEWVELEELGTMNELDHSFLMLKIINITSVGADSIYLNSIKHINESL